MRKKLLATLCGFGGFVVDLDVDEGQEPRCGYGCMQMRIKVQIYMDMDVDMTIYGYG